MEPGRCLGLLLVLMMLLNGVRNEDDDEFTQEDKELCCDEGTILLLDNCQPTPDQFDNQKCSDIAIQCCQELKKTKDEQCRAGIETARSVKECSGLENDASKCCEDCKLGIAFGGSSSCEGSSYAFGVCCRLAKEEKSQESTPATKPTPTTPKKAEPPTVPTPQTTPLKNVLTAPELDACDLVGHELCAHKCIVSGASYKCACRNGFKLRADGFSCQKAESNRCQKNNPCHQKCADHGDGIICSCNRGFELMTDNVSCIDINECELKTHGCRAGRKCFNTVGSYRCIEDTSQPKAPANKISCPPGYKVDKENQVCNDIDECLENPCQPGRLCVNTMGSYTCSHGGESHFSPKASSQPEASPTEELCPPGFRLHTQLADCVDIDECEEKKDDCNAQSQVCLNTQGSFTCQNKASKTSCPPGYKMVPGTGCVDIDECTEYNELCSADQECINEAGSYRCKPKAAGAEKPPSAPTPVRPPIPNPKPTPSRPPSRTNPPSCPRGYKRSRQGGCDDINECTTGNHSCDEYQDCHNTLGSHRCVCKRGFKKDHLTLACVDINECQSGMADCVAGQRCDNTVGSYQCIRYTSCGTGYTLNAASGICEDDNECELNTHNCHGLGPQYECKNTRGAFKCMRKKQEPTTTTEDPYYYYYDSNNGDEVPDPTAPVAPHPEPAPSSLEPPPEREEPTRTSPREEPPAYVPTREEPTPPTREEPRYTPSTWEEPKYSPPTREEPKYTPSTWEEPKYSPPTREEPRYTPPEKPLPQPKEYYPKFVEPTSTTTEQPVVVVMKPNDRKPINVDQNSDGHFVVDTNNLPKNTFTQLVPRQKHCLPGYEMSRSGECEDIDECATGRFACTANSEECKNTPGAYTCVCASGYLKDPYTGYCRKIYQSNQSPPLPRWPIITQPKTCDIGYHLNANTNECDDIDECADKNSRCATGEICVNTPGGYTCQCSEGLRWIQGRCVPIQPPVFTPPVRPPSRPSTPVRIVPVTKPTQYNYCPNGYRLNNEHRCVDKDECSEGEHSCSPDQQCVNVPGGYLCRCAVGHIRGKDGCEDIDECAVSGGKVCYHYSRCVNTIGSYKCDCMPGYMNPPNAPNKCTDVDECLSNEGKGPCHHKCINVWGSFRCACDIGYRLHTDNRTCHDLDECSIDISRRLCTGTCINTDGSYKCSCPHGYTLGKDKRSCNDIDECEIGALVCNTGEVCHNTRGGARCNVIACPPGYQRENNSNRCRKPRNCAYNDLECIRRPESISFNFITFSSNLPIPISPLPQVDLFTMRGPTLPGAILDFKLKMVEAKAPRGVEAARENFFRLTPSANQAAISMVKSLQGPQDVQLELSMDLYTNGGIYGGTAVAKLFIFVTQYEF